MFFFKTAYVAILLAVAVLGAPVPLRPQDTLWCKNTNATTFLQDSVNIAFQNAIYTVSFDSTTYTLYVYVTNASSGVSYSGSIVGNIHSKSPIVHGGSFYWNIDEYTMVRYETFSGIVWQTALPVRIHKYVAWDEKLFVACADGYVFGLDTRSGSKSWAASVTLHRPTDEINPLVPGHNRVLAGGRQLTGLRASDGTQMWATNFSTPLYVSATPKTEETGTIVVGSIQGSIRAYGMDAGTQLWSDSGSLVGAIHVVDGWAYYSTASYFIAVNMATGAGQLNVMRSGNLLFALPKVFVASGVPSYPGMIEGFNATNGRGLWTYGTSRSSFTAAIPQPMPNPESHFYAILNNQICAVKGVRPHIHATFRNCTDSSCVLCATRKVRVGCQDDGRTAYTCHSNGGVMQQTIFSGAQCTGSVVTVNSFLKDVCSTVIQGQSWLDLIKCPMQV